MTSNKLVFQALEHTMGFADPEWRVLATCHERRNKFEYEGVLNIDERLTASVTRGRTRSSPQHHPHLMHRPIIHQLHPG